MLLVKPIPDRSAAKELCELCGAHYSEDTYTYLAADVNDDATALNHVIGICSCKIRGGENMLTQLLPAPGIDDEEALLIMARTVLNFMYRCSVGKVTADVSQIAPTLAKKLGFSRDGDGALSLDLVEFYKSPCKFSKH